MTVIIKPHTRIRTHRHHKFQFQLPFANFAFIFLFLFFVFAPLIFSRSFSYSIELIRVHASSEFIIRSGSRTRINRNDDNSYSNKDDMNEANKYKYNFAAACDLAKG